MSANALGPRGLIRQGDVLLIPSTQSSSTALRQRTGTSSSGWTVVWCWRRERPRGMPI